MKLFIASPIALAISQHSRGLTFEEAWKEARKLTMMTKGEYRRLYEKATPVPSEDE